MEPKSGSNQGGKTAGQGSGSDTVSAAKISAGTSVGNVGQSPTPGGAQSSTLASHTSKPMGGSTTGSGQSSQGPEHMRHQDKDAGKGMGASGQGGGGSRQSGQSGQSGQSTADMVKDTAEQVQQKAGEFYEQASDMAGEAYEQASEWARSAYDQGSRYARRSMPDVGRYTGSVQRFVSENPVLVGVVGLAAGLLIGALLPRTRQEDRTFGRWADEVRDQGMRYARDMTQRGREMMEEGFLEGDDRFASHDSDWRRGERPGTSGRFQNH
jgi:ElaB/YqjD/DUF883 family membrane-anchored ribosome-binding protein